MIKNIKSFADPIKLKHLGRTETKDCQTLPGENGSKCDTNAAFHSLVERFLS